MGVRDCQHSDLCQKGQKGSLTCPHNQVFFTASAIWGLVGPKRQFGPGWVAIPLLAVATMVSKVEVQIRQHPNYPRWRRVHHPRPHASTTLHGLLLGLSSNTGSDGQTFCGGRSLTTSRALRCTPVRPDLILQKSWT